MMRWAALEPVTACAQAEPGPRSSLRQLSSPHPARLHIRLRCKRQQRVATIMLQASRGPPEPFRFDKDAEEREKRTQTFKEQEVQDAMAWLKQKTQQLNAMDTVARVLAEKKADDWLDQKQRELARAAPSPEQRREQVEAAFDWMATQSLSRLVAVFLDEPWATEAWAEKRIERFAALLPGQLSRMRSAIDSCSPHLTVRVFCELLLLEPSATVLRLSMLRSALPPGVDVASLCARRPQLLLEPDAATRVAANVAGLRELLPEVGREGFPTLAALLEDYPDVVLETSKVEAALKRVAEAPGAVLGVQQQRDGEAPQSASAALLSRPSLMASFFSSAK